MMALVTTAENIVSLVWALTPFTFLQVSLLHLQLAFEMFSFVTNKFPKFKYFCAFFVNSFFYMFCR
jgi:hypothetical protein